jgi:hypothetical protein
MLADTMMPEAFEHGGSVAGLFTTLGFAVAVALVTLDEARHPGARYDVPAASPVAIVTQVHDTEAPWPSSSPG